MEYEKEQWLKCKLLIEEKLGWGISQNWTNADFEALSEHILNETGVNLSTSTLKRLWGKVKYESIPQVSTLNALARFVGFHSYRDLVAAPSPVTFNQLDAGKKENKPESIINELTLSEKSAKKSTGKIRTLSSGSIWSIGMLMGITLSLLIAFSLTVKEKSAEEIEPALYTFSSRPVADGIPNSVVFSFDATAAKTDCVYIQQSWDPNRRFKVKKDQKQATSIYYVPGFYNAKLVVDNVVVKEHDLLISTEGWLPLLEQEPVPLYFKQEEAILEGILSLTEDVLKEKNISLQPVAPWVNYSNVQDFGNISSENFAIETGFKNTYSKGSGACQQSQLVVLCEDNVFVVPFSIPGCSSNLNAYFAGTQANGGEVDLSSLGVDFSDWVKLRLEVKNKEVQVYINDKPVLQSSSTQNAGKVIGIVFRFQGTGAVDYVNLFNGKGEMVYQDDF